MKKEGVRALLLFHVKQLVIVLVIVGTIRYFYRTSYLPFLCFRQGVHSTFSFSSSIQKEEQEAVIEVYPMYRCSNVPENSFCGVYELQYIFGLF
jgi:hypothetical protein